MCAATKILQKHDPRRRYAAPLHHHRECLGLRHVTNMGSAGVFGLRSVVDCGESFMKRRLPRIGAATLAAAMVVASFEFAAPAVAATTPVVSSAQRQHRLAVAQRAADEGRARKSAFRDADRGLAALRASKSQPQWSSRRVVGPMNAASFGVTVTPDTNLVPGALVAIDGQGFTVGASRIVFFAQCATDPASALLDCDIVNRPLGFLSDSGDFSTDFNVSRNYI